MTLYATAPWNHISHRSTHIPALLIHLDQRPFCSTSDIHRQVSFSGCITLLWSPTRRFPIALGRLRDRSTIPCGFPPKRFPTRNLSIFCFTAVAGSYPVKRLVPESDWHVWIALGCPRTSILLFTDFLIPPCFGVAGAILRLHQRPY